MNIDIIDEEIKEITEDDLNTIDDIVRFNNPTLSWLKFNQRVINESVRKDNPILEKLTFLGIADDNLDEFIRTKFRDKKIYRKELQTITNDIERTYEDLKSELKENYNIAIVKPEEIKNFNKCYESLKEQFRKKVFPVVQPLLLTDELPLPEMSDGATFLVSKLDLDNRILSGIIKLPDPELIEINSGNSGYKKVFVLNTDMIEEFISVFYKSVKLEWTRPFRVYRKIDSLIGSHSDNYVSSIRYQLSKRKTAKIIMYDVDEKIKYIDSILGDARQRKRKYVFGLSYLKHIKDYINADETMVFPKAKPRNPIDFHNGGKSIFDIISKNDILVHFPYEDFKLSTIRLLEEAAIDPNVKSIRQTLYRVSENSRLIKALMTAANNGKQVVVLLELKAKMDESNNIDLIDRLKSAGCNIIFGPFEIKVHAKTTLVIREENGKLEKYCNIATGNFNESTAKIYEDFSYFCKERNKYKVGTDLLDLFNYLGGYSVLDKSNKLLISPHTFRSTIENEIQKCIDTKINNPDENISITLKCNSFTDTNICNMLYKASSIGIKIKCVIRGMCIIKPGVEGLSENIEVISIVGRYLEHSRIYIFSIGTESNIFIGSGDIMPRNLDKRVEVLIPIKNKIINKKIQNILNLYFRDNTNSYKLIDDKYTIPEIIENGFSIQNYFIDTYKQLEKMSVK